MNFIGWWNEIVFLQAPRWGWVVFFLIYFGLVLLVFIR